MLSLSQIGFSYGRDFALEDISLDVKNGEVACLVGPSGCGKTSIMRLISGLTTPSSGEIRIHDTLVTKDGSNLIPTEQRKVGLVFQSQSLFPHYTVLENVAFGLRGMHKKDSEKRVDALLEIMQLSSHKTRYPAELSGGQQQRIAIARALAPEPEVLLLDEPFASLDNTIRKPIRDEMIGALKEANKPILVISHDPDEALSIADTVYVMEAGKLVQTGTPEEVYFQPHNQQAAELFGECNRIPIDSSSKKMVSTALGSISSEHSAVTADNNLLFRPEQLVESKDGIAGTITELDFMGHAYYATVKTEHGEFIVALASFPKREIGETIKVALR